MKTKNLVRLIAVVNAIESVFALMFLSVFGAAVVHFGWQDWHLSGLTLSVVFVVGFSIIVAEVVEVFWDTEKVIQRELKSGLLIRVIR